MKKRNLFSQGKKNCSLLIQPSLRDCYFWAFRLSERQRPSNVEERSKVAVFAGSNLKAVDRCSLGFFEKQHISIDLLLNQKERRKLEVNHSKNEQIDEFT